MTPEFAQYAWQNDMRIESSTGQVFSEAYRENVLHQGGVFDSFASTLAVIAANTLEPERAGDVLKTLQKHGMLTDLITLAVKAWLRFWSGKVLRAKH